MKSSVISHPEREPLIIIRAWQMEFCDGNGCAAALLSFFEYWHNIRLDMSDKAREANEIARQHGDAATEDESLWQFHTEDALEAGIMIYKRQTIRAAIELLIEKGVLDVGKNPNPRYKFDKTKFFMFKPEVVQGFLSSRSGKNPSRGGKNTGRSGKNPSRSGKNPSAIKETTSETTLETSPETTTAAADAGWESFPDEDVPPPKKNRSKNETRVRGLLVRAFSTKGGDKSRGPLIDEMLDEDPRREAWLSLPYAEVHAMYREATRLFEEEKEPFKATLKKLLNRATSLDRRQTAPQKNQKTQQQIDDENEAAYQEQQRADEELRRRREQTQASPPGGGSA